MHTSAAHPPSRRSEAQRLRAWFLDRNPRLRALPDHITRALFSMADVQRLRSGEVLCAADEPVRSMWGLVEGSVGAEREAAGRTRILREFEPGELIGLQGLLTNATAPVTWIAHLPSRLVRFDGFRLAELRASYHPLGQALLAGVLPLMVDEHIGLIRRTIDVSRARIARA